MLNDTERTRIKRERQEDFEMQRALEHEYKKGQSVSAVDVSDVGRKPAD